MSTKEGLPSGLFKNSVTHQVSITDFERFRLALVGTRSLMAVILGYPPCSGHAGLGDLTDILVHYKDASPDIQASLIRGYAAHLEHYPFTHESVLVLQDPRERRALAVRNITGVLTKALDKWQPVLDSFGKENR